MAEKKTTVTRGGKPGRRIPDRTLSPARLIARWWRSRGYGVHSPFAFRFIREVLCQSSPYYNYPLIEALPADHHWLKLLFRLIVEFKPSQLDAPSGLTGAERSAIVLADSRLASIIPEVPTDTPSGIITLRGDDVTVGVVRDIIAGNRDWLRLIDSLAPHVMTFTNGIIGIGVSRHDLPNQHYEINF